MGLKLSELSQGRERVHRVKVESLEGEEIMIRELTVKEATDFWADEINVVDGNFSDAGLRNILCMTLTDEDDATMTQEQAQSFIESNVRSVSKEILGHILSVHAGTEAGEP